MFFCPWKKVNDLLFYVLFFVIFVSGTRYCRLCQLRALFGQRLLRDHSQNPFFWGLLQNFLRWCNHFQLEIQLLWWTMLGFIKIKKLWTWFMQGQCSMFIISFSLKMIINLCCIEECASHIYLPIHLTTTLLNLHFQALKLLFDEKVYLVEKTLIKRRMILMYIYISLMRHFQLIIKRRLVISIIAVIYDELKSNGYY